MTKTILLPLLATAMLFPVAAQAQRFGGGDGTRLFDQADSNRDGRITRAEFERLDRNRDGAVSNDDFPRLASFRPDAAQRMSQMIASADGNGDGRITRAELANAPAPIFDRADTSRDNVITKAELDALRAQLAQFRQR